MMAGVAGGVGVMRRALTIAAGVAALLPVAAAAQDGATANGLQLDGTFRMRLEGIDNQFRPAPAAANDLLLTFRTTVHARYRADAVEIGAELIDSRAYLERDRSTVGTTEVNALELSQAYVGLDMGGVLGGDTRTRVTAGRFTMDIGSRRLVARNRFRNTINAFTGVRLDVETDDDDRLRAFWTLPHHRLPDDEEGIRHNRVVWDRESTDFQFFGASFTKAAVMGGTAEVYGYGLLERDGPDDETRDRHLFTGGFRLARNAGRGAFDYDLEATYQAGHARVSAAPADRDDQNVSAYLIHAEVGHTFAAAWSPRLSLHYDRASGDGPGGSYGRFDTLFGARRSEFGPTSLYGAVQRANLSSPALRLEAVPDKRLDGFLAYRALWLAEATDSFASTGVRDPSGRSGSFAGHQAEIGARYWLVPGLARLESGFALLFKGDFLRNAPDAPPGGTTRYGFIDVTVTF